VILPDFESLPEVLTVPETARVMRLGRDATYEAIRRGEIPAIRIGRRVLVAKRALRRLLAGEPEEGRNE
jgi:excisionase family DNA binding protein